MYVYIHTTTLDSELDSELLLPKGLTGRKRELLFLNGWSTNCLIQLFLIPFVCLGSKSSINQSSHTSSGFTNALRSVFGGLYTNKI